MIPRRLPRRGGPAVRWLIALALLATVTAACGGPAASFDPTGECLIDGRAAGAYPELETLVPRDLGGLTPTSVDSGRSCSDRALGTLTEHGVTEIRYAGATWDEGNGAGTSIAVLALPRGGQTGTDAASAASWAPLPVAWVEEFYEAGARASSKTSNVATSRPTMGEAGSLWRLDALNDLSQQAVVVRPFGDLVQVVLVATQVEPGASLVEHERRVELAVATAAKVAAPGGPSAEAVLPSTR